MKKMVMVRAIKRGTLSHSKGQFHFDPDGFAPAKKRAVPFDVATELVKKGLVKIVRSVTIEEDEAATVDTVAADRQEIQRDRLLSDPSMRMAGYFGADGPGDTMATTHTQRDRTETANTGGGAAAGTDGVVPIKEAADEYDDEYDLHEDEASDDDDAPPPTDAVTEQQIQQMGSSRERRAARAAAGGGRTRRRPKTPAATEPAPAPTARDDSMTQSSDAPPADDQSGE